MKGVKYDNDKPRWGLLPFRELEAVVDILTFGSKKYEDENWKKVPNGPERYYDAAMRHLTQYRMAKELDKPELINDEESGKSHLAHAMCCMLFMMWFDNNENEKIPADKFKDINIDELRNLDLSKIGSHYEDSALGHDGDFGVVKRGNDFDVVNHAAIYDENTDEIISVASIDFDHKKTIADKLEVAFAKRDSEQ